jgi:inner membrane protein
VPDIDGLGIVVDLVTRHTHHPTDWFSSFHHSLHTLLFAVIVTFVAFLFSNRSWKTAGFVFLSFHWHLLEDLLESRGPDGYQWPIPYLMPFSNAADLSWTGQWALNGWPNFAITIGLLLTTLYLAWSRGFSLLEMISTKADAAFVGALRRRVSA